MKKSITHVVFALLYLGAMAVCLFFIIKPGVSIFYLNKTIDNQSITPDTGYAYRYKLNFSPLFFQIREILLYEDGHPLQLAEDNIVVNTGENSYAISENSQGGSYLYFSSSDNSNPISNGRSYTLGIPTTLTSRLTGFILLLILLPGFLLFLYYALLIPENRATIFKSNKGILNILDQFFEHIPKINLPDSGSTRQQIKARRTAWKILFTITILAAYFYTLMEWIFYVTKPSFMSMMSFPEKLGVLLISGLFYSLLSMLLIAMYILLDILAILIHFNLITSYLIAVLPAFILTVLALLLIDNFTYTLFKFGISTSTGIWRGVYGLIFILIFSSIYLQLLKIFGLRGSSKPVLQISNHWFYLAIGILVISTGFALTKLDVNQLSSANLSTESNQASRYPNIILLGSDGLNADSMSVYGYERDTTPRMQELAQSSLVAENNFPNSSNSAGSVVSMLTSKLPTETRLLYAPDILTGANAYQHLPGLLKLNGYKTYEFGVPDYVDASSLNMQYGFDEVNGITQGESLISQFLLKLGYDNVDYFIYRLMGRASDRIKHIFYIQDMQNPYNIVTQRVRGISDQEKVTQMLDVVEQSPQPVFAHLHLLGTHGAKFFPPIQVFSKGEQQDEDWMVDYYDDAILSFDQYVGEVINRLKESGEYDNTILIIDSDHAMQYQVNERIPLIIHFPGDDYSGRISQNVQNLDIAPTILDYLGLAEPAWMSGKSILEGNLDSHRLIFSAGTVKVTENAQGLFTLDAQQVKPPFYQFSMVNVIDCQRWYQLNLTTYTWLSGDVDRYINPCSEDSLLSFDEIKQVATQWLLKDGFDVSSLP